jgi:nicotinate dehydrogenase subunit A
MNSESKIIRCLINGQVVEVSEAKASISLLNYLREPLGLTRTRFGCGAGACGACTVICNGEAVTSCDKLLIDLEGAQIETPESLGSVEEPHPIFASLLQHQAVQCGYCISGIAMRVKALLDSDPKPSKQALDTALDHHLCRCGTHVRIKRAMHDLIFGEA